MARPNLLVFMTDQLAPQFLPCHGHPVVRAPVIQRLAAEGVVFDAAYTNSPLSAAARAVVMSGRLPAAVGARDNGAEFPAELPAFAHYLSAEGYATALSGKMHFVGPDQLHGNERRLTADIYPADLTWHRDRPGERLDWFHNMGVVRMAGECVRSVYLDHDDEVVHQAKRFLFDQAGVGGERPFALTVSPIQPHEAYHCRPQRWSPYRDEDSDLPAVAPGSAAEDPHSARLRHGYGASDVDLDEATVRRACHGGVSHVDAKLGEVLAALEETGPADYTVVAFIADHGDMPGERGMWFKMTLLEHAARVPLVVRAPCLFAPRRVPQAVSLVDLLPTRVDMARDGAGGAVATPVDGRALLTQLRGGKGHDEVVGEYYADGAQAPMFTVRRGTRKLIHTASAPAQYFDLLADPAEVRDLAGEPAYGAEVGALVAALDRRYHRAALTARVLQSQRRRRFLKGVMRDQGVAWDHEPRRDASRAWIRNTMPIYELEKRGRFPRV